MIVQPHQKIIRDELHTFVKQALQRNALFNAEMSFSRASEADLDKLVDAIATSKPIHYKRDDVLADKDHPFKNKLLIVYKGQVNERLLGTSKRFTYEAGRLYGDVSFFRGSNHVYLQVSNDDVRDEGEAVVTAGSHSCTVFELSLETYKSIIDGDMELDHIDLLKKLSSRQLEEFTASKIVERFPRGHTILKRGDDNQSPDLYIILSGLVELCTDDEHHHHHLLSHRSTDDTHRTTGSVSDEEHHSHTGERSTKYPVLGPGDHFGEYSLIFHSVQAYNVVAISEVSLLKIPKSVCKSDVFKPAYSYLKEHLKAEKRTIEHQVSQLNAGHSERSPRRNLEAWLAEDDDDAHNDDKEEEEGRKHGHHHTTTHTSHHHGHHDAAGSSRSDEHKHGHRQSVVTFAGHTTTAADDSDKNNQHSHHHRRSSTDNSSGDHKRNKSKAGNSNSYFDSVFCGLGSCF